MSSNIQVSSSSTSNFRRIFEKALEEYEKKTGKDLTSHPLAAEIKSCDSPGAILTVLEGKANELNQPRSSDERLTKWLNPTVNILNAISATLGEGAGSVFPPTKIIFSGIGILLVAAKRTVANRDVLVELFDRIESFFGRLETYTEVPPTQVVTEVLAKIMAEVLSILAIATRGVKERRIRIFLKKLAGMNDIEDALQRLRNLEQGELLTVIAQVSRDTRGVRDDAKETKGMVKEIVNKMDARQWKQFLRDLEVWLSPPDPSTNYKLGLRAYHEGTATWFLKGKILREWDSTGSLLWIHGKPGSGKSILCSAIIQHIASLCDDGRASMAYFYFDFRDENKKHRHNLLPSLLVQFAAHSIPCRDIISRVYSARGEGIQHPSDEDLMSCLKDMLSASPHPMYIIMDALDECPNSSGVRSPREQVLSFVEELVGLRLWNLQICVTSRLEMDIRNRLESLTSLRISLHDQSGQKEDIAKYIRSEVDFIAKERRWRESDKLVIEALSEKVDGMFRWVFCQLEMLRLCLQSSVRHFINELPDNLDETYERILKGIHKTNRGPVLRLLQCLVVAIRPLRVEEVAEILKSDADVIEEEVLTFDGNWSWSDSWKDQEQEVLSACPSLITIESRVVQFSHFSVKEFLTSGRLATSSEDISRYHILPNAAHTTLAQLSLGTLLRLNDHVDSWNIPLAKYSAEHWVSHVQLGSGSSHVMSTMKTLFNSDKPHFAAWVRTYDIDQPHPCRDTPVVDFSTGATSRDWYLRRKVPKTKPEPVPKPKPKPLYYSALCGFHDLVEHLVKKHSQHVNLIGGKHDNPLVAALHGGHIRVAELLLQHGANVDIRGTEEQTPLHIAIKWPINLAVVAVQFLLKHGADGNARREDLSTPLHLAAARGYFEVTQLLLQHTFIGISCEVGGKFLLHPVTKPLYQKSEANLVQLLLEYGADVNSRDEDDATALHHGSPMWDLEVTRALLNHGANCNAQDKQGRTPLHRVLEVERYSDEDRFGVAQLLVERGADVNAREEDQKTPLHLTSFSPELKLVRMLLDHGANVNAEDNRGRTLLHRVLEDEHNSEEDRFGAAQLLLGRGADVNERTEDHETPLLLASYFPEPKLVQMLLNHGTNVNAEGNRTRNLLHRVLKAGYYLDEDCLGVARLLLERGVDVNTRDEDHETPLHLASHLLKSDLVRMFLDHGANVNVVDNQGRTPLHRVMAEKGFYGSRFGVAQLLIEHGADVNKQDKDHETPFLLACYFLELRLVRMLLNHGANVNVGDNRGWTPLHLVWQAKGYFPDEDRFGVAQLLVEHGADVNAQDKVHETPLLLACYSPELTMMRMLLNHGANVNMDDNRSWTPLHRVLKAKDFSDKDRFGVAQLLVEHGADVNARDEDHETPLHLATYFWELRLKLVRMLLHHGASVNAENNQGQTPLRRVMEDNGLNGLYRIGVIQLLIRRGVDVNKRDKDHETPLHIASRHVLLETAWILLKHGADLYAENKEGKIPFQLARESIREEMKRLESDSYLRHQLRAKSIAVMGLLYGY